MNSTYVMYVCLPCAVLLAILTVFVWLNEKGVNPMAELVVRYRRLPRLAQIALAVFVVNLIVYGSTKSPTNDVSGSGSSTNAVAGGGSSTTNAPAGGLMMVAPQFAWLDGGFSTNELAAGYALWRVGTNEVWSFDAMPGAHIVESWRLRGAADDWALCMTTNLGPVAMTTDGRLVTTNGAFAAFDGMLAIVPEVNWPLVGTNAPSRAWWAETPWQSTVFTWQNAFLGRDTNLPVSVQAEFTRDGDFIYRYDLASVGTNLTSLLYYRITPEDLEDADRDGDGLTTYDEVSLYHTDPGLVDSDGDGIADNEEIWDGTDPTTRSVPNEEIVARIVGSATNELYRDAWELGADGELNAMKLWDGFAAEWPTGMTNLVYERTLNLGTMNGWQRFFLSSKADEAGDWGLRGLVLEWDDGRGRSGAVTASPLGDSWPLPATNATVTIRLRAISPKIRCPKPMYLIGYAPVVSISGGRCVCSDDGKSQAYCLTAGEAEMSLAVSIDRSHRPCKAALGEDELRAPGLDDLEVLTDGALTYAGGANGGTITVQRPGCIQLPDFAVSKPHTPTPRPRLMSSGAFIVVKGGWIICLDPSIDYSGDHRFVSTGITYDESAGGYCYAHYYPLDSKCLWRSWRTSEDGSWKCSCEPEVKAGGGADDLSFVEKSYALNDDRSLATGRVSVFGEEVWTGTAAHSWRDVGSGGGTSTGSELLSKRNPCDDDCDDSCADGNCDVVSGGGLNSVKFRLSLGSPRRGQHSGFLYFESDDPVAITPSLLQLEARDDAAIWTSESGATTTYFCGDSRGRDVVLAPIADGVRLTVNTHETGTLDESWEIVNEDGDTNVVRIVQISRLNNVMSDETYAYDEGVWTKTDNITGVAEVLERTDHLNDPADGRLYETRTQYDADGNQLDCVSTVSSRIGAFGNAVLRETYWERDTGTEILWREATYWNDPTHRDRHGQVKLVWGNDTAWEYHDYDTRGFETLLVEQRNGSAVPTAFPSVIAGELYFAGGLTDATVTVYDYTPFTGDDNHLDDADKVRCETRYVVRNGLVTCIGRTWTRYTHVYYGSYDAVKAETWRAATKNASRTAAANAYSYAITYSETEPYVPLVLRGELAEELDEDGVLTCRSVSDEGDVVVEETHRWFGEVEFATCEVTERDAVYGNETRRATYLNDGDTLIGEETSTYDEKNRLRSTTYADGTSLTNAFSCCRKLWSSDREGRKTLRSAVTGQDRLYYAEEEVWLRELSTNGEHKVTQHFFDGLGREIETAVYSAAVAGEATSATASEGKTRSVSTVSYPYGGDDYAVSVDARGKTTVRERQAYEDREESVVAVYAAEAAASSVQTQTTQYRGGNRVTEKTWDGKWTRETEICDYDASGCEIRRTVTESSDCGTVTNRVSHFDFLGRTVLEETPLGNTATTYHGSSSRADATTFTAGNVTRTSTALYSDWGESVGSVQDGVARRTDESYEMDDGGAWWKVTREEVSADDDVESVTERREQLTDRAAGVISREIAIDADGVTEETVERFGETEGERVTTFSNAVAGVTVRTSRRGRVTALRTPERTEANAYDSFGRQVGRMHEAMAYNVVGDVVARRTYTNEAAFVSETYDYDCFGRRVRTVDALGNEKTTAYDAVGNVVEESGATYPVRYGFDTAGRRVSLSTTKDGRIWDVTTWGYDPSTGKCTAKRYPDGSQVAYSYTPDGLPLVTTLASGRTTTNVYDAKRLQVGSLSSDAAGDATYAYDAFGKMTAATNAVAGYAYRSHRGGIVTNETATVDGTGRTFVRTVDAYGRLAERGLADGPVQAITYDAANRVATIATTEAVATYAYGDDGTDLGLTLTLANGTVVTRQIARDEYRQQVVSVSNFVNGAAVGGCAYGRDALGRIVRRDEAGGDTTTVTYDEVGQVVQVSSYPLLSTNYQLTSYSYDQIGNIVGSETLAYTTDGGVAGLDGKTFTYDSAMRLTSVATGGVSVATYDYDAFGRRVRKTTPAATTLYFYDGWNLVREETSGSDGGTVEYVWGKDIAGSLDTAGGIGGLLYLKRNGTIYVPLYDANGHIVAYIDATGAMVAEYAYDAFGNAVSPTANDFSFRYSTKYHDEETGFSYYGYRYYAPMQARWLTRDPLEEQGGLNLHTFCENDGVNKYDWLGLKATEPTQDDDGRRFWRLIARRLRREKQYNRAAEMLETSLDHNSWLFNGNDRMSQAIKNSSEYDLLVKDVMDSYAIGWQGSVDRDKKLEYGGGDLLSAVNPDLTKGADVHFGGRGCKGTKKTWFKFNVKVVSEYGYGDWRYDDLTLSEEDKSKMEKYKSLVKELSWFASFKDRR